MPQWAPTPLRSDSAFQPSVLRRPRHSGRSRTMPGCCRALVAASIKRDATRARGLNLSTLTRQKAPCRRLPLSYGLSTQPMNAHQTIQGFTEAVQLAAEPRRGRPTKFTPERMRQITNLVERGKSREEIAEIIGVTTGTLQVTCSKLGISLRQPRFDTGTDMLRHRRPGRVNIASSPGSDSQSILIKQCVTSAQDQPVADSAPMKERNCPTVGRSAELRIPHRGILRSGCNTRVKRERQNCLSVRTWLGASH